jgi:hypothetical protein
MSAPKQTRSVNTSLTMPAAELNREGRLNDLCSRSGLHLMSASDSQAQLSQNRLASDSEIVITGFVLCKATSLSQRSLPASDASDLDSVLLLASCTEAHLFLSLSSSFGRVSLVEAIVCVVRTRMRVNTRIPRRLAGSRFCWYRAPSSRRNDGRTDTVSKYPSPVEGREQDKRAHPNSRAAMKTYGEIERFDNLQRYRVCSSPLRY